MLVDAYRYALDVERSVWDFAIRIGTLRKAGCTDSELRWLVCRSYVDHAPEFVMPDEESRMFRHQEGDTARLRFSRKTCFVLTKAGLEFAEMHQCDKRRADSNGQSNGAGDVPANGQCKPQWDRDRQELRLGDSVIKQFKVPATNQERILATFEEEGWPIRIDDPLPPSPDQDSKRRLHDTINSLNRNQKRRLLHFVGDGSGQGIRWELVNAPKQGKSGNGRLP